MALTAVTRKVSRWLPKASEKRLTLSGRNTTPDTSIAASTGIAGISTFISRSNVCLENSLVVYMDKATVWEGGAREARFRVPNAAQSPNVALVVGIVLALVVAITKVAVVTVVFLIFCLFVVPTLLLILTLVEHHVNVSRREARCHFDIGHLQTTPEGNASAYQTSVWHLSVLASGRRARSSTTGSVGESRPVQALAFIVLSVCNV